MPLVQKLKKNIRISLKKIINQNSFINDIWIYGNLSDQISDLDLIVVYKKKPEKINFPNFIKTLIADGSVIYTNDKDKNKLFLFEDLKVRSVKKNKIHKYKIKKKYIKFRFLSSFLERYYERRLLINNKNIYLLNENNLRDIKSIFFSYENFCNLYQEKLLKNKIKKLFKKYLDLRSKHNSNKLRRNIYRNYVNNLRKFDKEFLSNSFTLLEKSFKNYYIQNHSYKFNKKIVFRYFIKNKKNIYKIPKIFFIVYFFYASCKLSISKKILKDFSKKKIIEKKKSFNNIFEDSFNEYLRKKIKYINKNYEILKKQNFNSGLYRFSWYLKR